MEEGLELLEDASAVQQHAAPCPLWATHGCGILLVLLLAVNLVTAIVIWASPHPVNRTYGRANEDDFESQLGSACVYADGSSFLKRGSQLNSCGQDAYCCAGGAQASKDNCQNAMSAEQTAKALGVTALSIRACCHVGGYDPTKPAHVTVASNNLAQSHRLCPQQSLAGG